MSGRNGRNPKSPAFQLYPTDFLADPKVAAMNAAEVGAYFLLLCFGWLDGGLPNDHRVLARLARMTTGEFELAWIALGECWKPDAHGRLRNPRQERERASLHAFKAECSEAGKRGNKARWGAQNGVSDRVPDADPMQTRSGSDRVGIAPVSRIPYPVKKRRAPRAPASPSDFDVVWSEFPELDKPEVRSAWAEHEAVRRAKRKGQDDPTNLRIKLRELQQFGADGVREAFTTSAANGYQGVFPPKAKRGVEDDELPLYARRKL